MTEMTHGLVSYIIDKHYTGAIDGKDAGDAVMAFLSDVSDKGWYLNEGADYVGANPMESEIQTAIGAFMAQVWLYESSYA